MTARDLLVYGVVGPLLAWALHFALVWGLAFPTLRHESRVVLYGLSIACVSLTAQGTWLGFSELHRQSGLSASRVRATMEFFAKSALVLGTFFTLVILAQTLPFIFLGLGD